MISDISVYNIFYFCDGIVIENYDGIATLA